MHNESCSCSPVDTCTVFLSLQFWPIHTNSQLYWSFLCPSGWKNWTGSSGKWESQVLIIIRWICKVPVGSALFLHFSAHTKSLSLLCLIPVHGIVHHSTLLSTAEKILNIKDKQQKKKELSLEKAFLHLCFMICGRKFCNERQLFVTWNSSDIVAVVLFHYSKITGITLEASRQLRPGNQDFCRNKVLYLYPF